MAIHHSTQARAEKYGVILSETPDNHDYSFQAHWPKQNQRLFGNTAAATLDDMIALIDMRTNYKSFQSINGSQDDNGRAVYHIKVRGTDIEVKSLRLKDAFDAAVNLWKEHRAEMEEGDEDDSDDEQEAEGETGSVVSTKYRAKYAELGHPTHCGDWLATTLNNFVANKKGSDIATFEAICAANGIDTSKYNRTTPGWQGRIRMTGRNMLAKVVYATGELKLHNDMEALKAPADWIEAQRFVKEGK